MMEFMEDLKELVHKGEQIAQQMQQSGNFGQRRSYGRYGMRDNQSGYSGGMTPLLDRDGKPVVSPIVNRYEK